MYKHVPWQYMNQYMTSKSRGHCDNIKVFNQGKSNQIREKSGNLIAKNVWPPWMIFFIFANFSKNRKNWRFPPPRPWGPFSLFSYLCPDFIQMSEFLYLSCPDVKLWWFSSFLQTFRKLEKIEDFPHPGPGDPFCSFHTCAQISSKWVNFYILVVLMSNYDDFLHFCKLFENSKKLKISPTPALGTLFACFTLAPRFHPNEWIFIS